MSPEETYEPAGTLGAFLRERRARLQPQASDRGRRRTPGLRREEIATRAGVSATWYTWLEQGRRGPPSVDVLERLATALELDPPSREILFLLGQRRPPPLHRTSTSQVPPALMRVLRSMRTSPAFIRTTTWDIVAWNAAAAALLEDYGALPVQDRNVLRRIFCNPMAKRELPNWEEHARYAVAHFRLDVARAGGSSEADALATELSRESAEFRTLWAEHNVRGHGIGERRPAPVGDTMILLERSSFAVNGADGLTLVVYSPGSDDDEDAIATYLATTSARGSNES